MRRRSLVAQEKVLIMDNFFPRRLVGKQNIEKDSSFSTCALIGDNIYAFTNHKRLPIKLNLKTKDIVLIEDLKGYDSQFVADEMQQAGNNIFVLEVNGNRLMEYNIEKRTCRYYEIGCHKEAWGNYVAFAKWKEELYIFPKYKDKIIKINIESGKIKEINFLEYAKIVLNSPKDKVIFWYGFQDKNLVWLFGKKSNLVLVYDLESNTWRKHELSEKINSCIHAVMHNGYMYILSSEGKVYRWDMKNNSIKVLADCGDIKDGENIFFRIAVTEKNIFLFPSLGEDILCIDLKKKQIDKYMTYPPDFMYCGPDEWSKYYGYCEDEDFYYFAMRSMNFIPCVNKRIGNIKWLKLEVPAFKEYMWFYIKKNKRLLEEKECKIVDIVDYIENSNEKSQEKEYILVGEQIFRQLKS